ncbi:serine hydrolase domain-containing protein [Peterkaempfera bronchialis]|uniref:serine hydrolase domain-containing protein n=1 Tax=Peterkaempfera bronchialis TaxID=2126346 RepID=UPI003C30B82C
MTVRPPTPAPDRRAARHTVRVAVGLLAATATTLPLLLPATTAYAAPGAAATRAAVASPPRAVALQRRLDAMVAAGSKAVLAEVREGTSRWSGAAGTADLATGAPARADGRFRIGSITKTFTATVVLQLVQEGRIRLDDPLARYLPGVLPGAGSPTVRQVLNHTAGVYNYTEDTRVLPDITDPAATRAWLARGRWQTWTPQRIAALAAGHRPYFRPGTGWHYSNTDYILAGMLIEKVTGRSYASEITRRILRPLGLRHTTLPGTSRSIPGPHAHGYLDVDGEPVDTTLMNPSVAGAAGEVISSTADLARFNAALLSGRLLRPAALREMTTTVDLGGGSGYGLGLMRYTTRCGTAWGHPGSIPGYGSLVIGTADGRRRLALSYNPPTHGDGRALNSALNALADEALCGGSGAIPARAPRLLPALSVPSAPSALPVLPE